MAFNKTFWARVSAAGNTEYRINQSTSAGVTEGAPSLYSYLSQTDTVAQILAADYFLPVVRDLKVGDLIYCVGSDTNTNVFVQTVFYEGPFQTVQVSGTNLVNGVTNFTGGVEGNVPIFADNTGLVIRDSGIHINDIPLLMTHFLVNPFLTVSTGIEISNISFLQYVNGVGTVFVDSLTALQHIENNFGPDSQVCTLITGGLPSSSTSPSALLELQSTTGVLVVSRMTTTEVGDLTSPPDGSIVYDTVAKKFLGKQDGMFHIFSTPGPSDGTVTSVATGTGLTGGPITTTGTISIANTTVTPGSYTFANFTVNAQGQLTAASNGLPVLTVNGTASNISSSGGQNPVINLIDTAVTPGSYTYTSLTVDQKGRLTLASSGTPPVLSVSGTAGRVSSSGGQNPVIDLSSSGVTPGAYTNANLTVDTYGRITMAANGSTPDSTAKYILQTADGGLPNAQSLGDPAFFPTSGLVWNDVAMSTGVLRLATPGVDYPTVASVTAAQGTATSAAAAALVAQTTANTAVSSAAAAQTTANSALSTANTALAATVTLAFEKYIVQQSNVFIPNAQSLGDLTTGLLKNTVTGSTGVLSTAVVNTDYPSVARVTALEGVKYIIQQANAAVPSAQDLGSLSTGILKSTTGTGVISITTPGTDYYAPGFPTTLKDTTGGLNNFFAGTSAGANITTGVRHTGVSLSALLLATDGADTTACGYQSASLRTTYTNCVFFGSGADASVNALTNAGAIGQGSSVGISNALVLGKGMNIGVGKDSPIYALDLGTDHSMLPLLRMASTALPAAPAGANEGIYSVNLGRPFFTGGTSPYSGKIALARTTGSDALAGTATLTGTTAVVINTTAVLNTSLIFVTVNTGTAALVAGAGGRVSAGAIVSGTSFEIISSAADTRTVNWWIINP